MSTALSPPLTRSIKIEARTPSLPLIPRVMPYVRVRITCPEMCVPETAIHDRNLGR